MCSPLLYITSVSEIARPFFHVIDGSFSLHSSMRTSKDYLSEKGKLILSTGEMEETADDDFFFRFYSTQSKFIYSLIKLKTCPVKK